MAQSIEETFASICVDDLRSMLLPLAVKWKTLKNFFLQNVSITLKANKARVAKISKIKCCIMIDKLT